MVGEMNLILLGVVATLFATMLIGVIVRAITQRTGERKNW